MITDKTCVDHYQESIFIIHSNIFIWRTIQSQMRTGKQVISKNVSRYPKPSNWHHWNNDTWHNDNLINSIKYIYP